MWLANRFLQWMVIAATNTEYVASPLLCIISLSFECHFDCYCKSVSLVAEFKCIEGHWGLEKCASCFDHRLKSGYHFNESDMLVRGNGQRGHSNWSKCPLGPKQKAIQKASQRGQRRLIWALFLVKCMAVLAGDPVVDLSTQIRGPLGRYGHMWMANQSL